MPALRTLYLNNSPFTDEGLAQVSTLTRLTRLGLHGTKVTDAGVARLREALPGCDVKY